MQSQPFEMVRSNLGHTTLLVPTTMKDTCGAAAKPRTALHCPAVPLVGTYHCAWVQAVAAALHWCEPQLL